MKTSKLLHSVLVSVFALGLLAGCGKPKAKTHFGGATADAGESVPERETPSDGGRGASGGTHSPSGSPSSGRTGNTPPGSTTDLPDGSTPIGSTGTPGPGTTGPGGVGLDKNDAAPPPSAAASVDDDPAGIDTEFLDDRGPV